MSNKCFHGVVIDRDAENPCAECEQRGDCNRCGETWCIHELDENYLCAECAKTLQRCSDDAVGTCTYCGQVAAIEAGIDLPRVELNRRATLLCSCTGGHAARQANDACERLEQLMADEDNENVTQLMRQAIFAIQDEGILNIAAKLDEKTTLKIRKNATGAFIITKTTTKTKQEVV